MKTENPKRYETDREEAVLRRIYNETNRRAGGMRNGVSAVRWNKIWQQVRDEIAPGLAIEL